MMKSTNITVSRVTATHNALSMAGGMIGKTLILSERGYPVAVASSGVLQPVVWRSYFMMTVEPELMKTKQVKESINSWIASRGQL